MGGKRHDILPPLTEQEDAALRDYAARHGRSWKRILNFVWMGEAPLDDGQVLRKLRNTHGPTWLDRYRLPKRPAVAKRSPADDPGSPFLPAEAGVSSRPEQEALLSSFKNALSGGNGYEAQSVAPVRPRQRPR